jgi:hypothetical protein
MSWGALPWWVYESMHQREMMLVSGAMIEELYSGMPQAMAEHTWSINSSVFATHDIGGWNHGRISNYYDSLTQG